MEYAHMTFLYLVNYFLAIVLQEIFFLKADFFLVLS